MSGKRQRLISLVLRSITTICLSGGIFTKMFGPFFSSWKDSGSPPSLYSSSSRWLVFGGVSVLLQQSSSNISNEIQVGDIQRALSHSIPCGTNGSLGAGCVDFNQAVSFIEGMNMPTTTTTTAALTK